MQAPCPGHKAAVVAEQPFYTGHHRLLVFGPVPCEFKLFMESKRYQGPALLSRYSSDIDPLKINRLPPFLKLHNGPRPAWICKEAIVLDRNIPAVRIEVFRPDRPDIPLLLQHAAKPAVANAPTAEPDI